MPGDDPCVEQTTRTKRFKESSRSEVAERQETSGRENEKSVSNSLAAVGGDMFSILNSLYSGKEFEDL